MHLITDWLILIHMDQFSMLKYIYCTNEFALVCCHVILDTSSTRLSLKFKDVSPWDSDVEHYILRKFLRQHFQHTSIVHMMVGNTSILECHKTSLIPESQWGNKNSWLRIAMLLPQYQKKKSQDEAIFRSY